MSGSSNTLFMALTPLKQSKLGGIVDHSELLQQSLDDLTSGCPWANVQVLGRILWQVERSAPFNSTSLLPCAVMTSFLRRCDRHRPRQLELHFYETGIGTIFVLPTQSKRLHRMINLRQDNMCICTKPNHSLNSWRDCCWPEHYIPSFSAGALQLSTPPSHIQLVHPERASSYRVRPADDNVHPHKAGTRGGAWKVTWYTHASPRKSLSEAS